jgi:hypothetical protein
MKAHEVFINGRRVCLAGVGDDGVLSTIVNWVGDPSGDDYCLTVTGLDNRTGQHFKWDIPPVEVGAEVLVRLVEVPAVDSPSEWTQYEKQVGVELCRRYFRECGAQLTGEERAQLLRELIAELEESGRADQSQQRE